jgi:hypothetical protein
MKVSGIMIKWMGEAPTITQMVTNLKAIGKITKGMGKELNITKMEIKNFKVIGRMINIMGREFTILQTEMNIRVIG